MPGFSATDCAHMARALRLAERGIYTAHPNPAVGCVIVNDGEVVGEGWHEAAGRPHAEVNALAAAGAAARGAIVYVTLEPCAHHGRTPPCTEALIDAGVGEVVVGLEDPDPRVDGSGIAALEAAGIRVRSGLMAASVRALNPRVPAARDRAGGRSYGSRSRRASMARTAMANGQSQWITGAEARGGRAAAARAFRRDHDRDRYRARRRSRR